MIIYDKIWLRNLAVQEDLKKAHRAGDLDTETLKKIAEKYPVGFYAPNLFIRIGLFLLTCIIMSFSVGLISLFLSDHVRIDTSGYVFFWGLITYAALERMIYQFHHFKSGIDEALMWISAGSILTSFVIFQNLDPFATVTYGFIFILAGYFTLRFADLLMALITFFSFLAFLFLILQSGLNNLSALPFAIILSSAAIYFLTAHWAKRFTNYANCLIALQIASLLMIYAGGNYYVVREMGAMVNNVTIDADQSLQLGWFFWLWTVAMPLLYIGLGIKRKDVIILRSGLILVVAAAFTFRNYYHVMPIEGTLSLAGAALLALSYGIIRYLKTPKYGLTSEEQEEEHLMDAIKIESLIVSETFSGQQAAPESNRMGGGNFGGGGATGNF